MKKLLSGNVILLMCIMGSCSKSGNSPVIPVVDKTIPKVVLNKTSIIADGYDECMITIVDSATNADITSKCSVTVGGVFTTTPTSFSTTIVGTLQVTAKYKTKNTTPVNLVTTDKGPSKYTQKVLVEDYTGSWCGYCPKVANALASVNSSNANVLIAAVHNADPMSYVNEASMRSKYGVSGWPTAMVNRSYEWNDVPSSLTNLTTRWAPVGLAIESAISGNTISGKVKVEYNVSTRYASNITIMLLEDGKVYPQTNYYNTTTGSPLFGMGNPIPNFVHDNILRIAATDIFGDDIPTSIQVKGAVYEKTFSFNATGYNLSKCKVLAFASWKDGIVGKKGVINAQVVKAGQNKNYD